MKIGCNKNEDGIVDATPLVRQALAECLRTGDRSIEFEHGRYDFFPDRATEKFLFISNNDDGLKRIVFPLIDVNDLVIVGNGAQFVFHGEVVPFAVLDSSNVRLQGFSIDWERTFHSEASVLRVDDVHGDRASVTLHFPPQYPYRVQNERLVFLDETGKEHPFHNALEYDPIKRETAFQVYDNYKLASTHSAIDIAPCTVRLTGKFGTIPTVGNVLSIVHYGRECPAIVISDSTNTEIVSVAIHHAGGMGVIAQRSTDIRLERVYVTPPPDKERLISLVADATHFANCAGHIELIDCLFVGQMDDPCNVHGIYARISEIVSDREIEVTLVHPQQYGVQITQAGDTVEVADQNDLCGYHRARVVTVEPINSQRSVLRFDDPVPAGVKVGDIVSSTSWVADLTIRGCTARSNRARGFLISTAGRVLVEQNTIHSPGAAILIAGDGNHWFESGPVRDVLIRDNHFDNCLYGVWGRAVIDINPEVDPDRRSDTFYHSGIRIEDNTFTVFDQRLVMAHCVSGLTFTGNRIVLSDSYPAQPEPANRLDVTDCRFVHIDLVESSAKSAPLPALAAIQAKGA